MQDCLDSLKTIKKSFKFKGYICLENQSKCIFITSIAAETHSLEENYTIAETNNIIIRWLSCIIHWVVEKESNEVSVILFTNHLLTTASRLNHCQNYNLS